MSRSYILSSSCIKEAACFGSVHVFKVSIMIFLSSWVCPKACKCTAFLMMASFKGSHTNLKLALATCWSPRLLCSAMTGIIVAWSRSLSLNTSLRASPTLKFLDCL